MKRKIFSILLSLAVALTMIPMETMPAFAEGETGTIAEVTENEMNSVPVETPVEESDAVTDGKTDFAPEIQVQEEPEEKLLMMLTENSDPHTHGTGTEAITFSKAINNFGDLQNLFADGGNGYLAADITATAGLTVEANVDLCLNGKKLNLDDKGNITVSSGKTLNLYDCGNAGIITGGTAEHGGGVYVNGGTFNMYGGSITGNEAQYGAGVDNNGTFKMYGGEITNNYATQLGGGINLNGTFNMSGGEITKNKTADNKNGGGVYVNSGAFTMDGGKIADNNAQYGAGVYVNSGTFTMTDDSVISGNTGGQGAGVYSKGTFTMSENSEITENTGTNGGGVGIGGGTFTMTESSKITHNTGTTVGGVYIQTGTFKMTGGTVDHNTCSNDGYSGGVYANGTITLGGTAKITDNVIGGTISGGVLTGGTANNVFLPNDKYITLETNTKPTDSFKVGVTTQIAPTEVTPVKITTNGTADDAKYFTSDNADYEVQCNTNGYLELAVKPEVTITFDMNGHGNQISEMKVKKGDRVTKPVDPTADGWIFGGWYKDAKFSAKFDFNSEIIEDTTIYAKWTKEQTVDPTDSEDADDNASTGDNSSIFLPVTLLILALLGAGAVISLRRKKER